METLDYVRGDKILEMAQEKQGAKPLFCMTPLNGIN